MKRLLPALPLVMLGCQTEAASRAELEKDGFSEITLTKDDGGYSFEATKNGEKCTGSIAVKKGFGSTNVTKFYQCGTSKPAPACSAETPEVCSKLAFEKEKAGDMAAARELYGKGCDAGHAGSCNDLGVLLLEGRGGSADPAAATAKFNQACDGKDGNACKNLGIAHTDADPPKHDAAAEAFQRACDLKHAGGCIELGRSHLEGRGVPRDQDKAVSFFEVACGLGSHQGCGAQGLYLILGKPPNVEKGLKLVTEACDKDVGEACRNLGVLHRDGHVPPKDPVKAFGLFERACGLKDGGGCNAVGFAAERGLGTKRDLDGAIQHYTKACELGEMLGCMNLGIAHRDGLGVPKDAAKAFSMLDKACSGGEPKACELAKSLAPKN